jgi:hypothetical protein
MDKRYINAHHQTKKPALSNNSKRVFGSLTLWINRQNHFLRQPVRSRLLQR